MNAVAPVFIIIAIAAFYVSAEPACRYIDAQGNAAVSSKPVLTGKSLQKSDITFEKSIRTTRNNTHE